MFLIECNGAKWVRNSVSEAFQFAHQLRDHRNARIWVYEGFEYKPVLVLYPNE